MVCESVDDSLKMVGRVADIIKQLGILTLHAAIRLPKREGFLKTGVWMMLYSCLPGQVSYCTVSVKPAKKNLVPLTLDIETVWPWREGEMIVVMSMNGIVE
jgi:hypothetical protein